MPKHENNTRKAKEAILSITFPDDDQSRARKVVTRSRARATGKFPSAKMKRMIQWESIPERNAFRLLEADPKVVAYREQPCEIRYEMDGELRLHVPDILVRFRCGKEFWEVKPAEDAMRQEVADRTNLLTRLLPANGYKYQVVLAEELSRQPRLENLAIVLRYGRGDVSNLIKEKIRQLLQSVGAITWDSVLNGSLAPINRNHICRLTLSGFLHLDLNQPLSSTTLITLKTAPKTPTDRDNT